MKLKQRYLVKKNSIVPINARLEVLTHQDILKEKKEFIEKQQGKIQSDWDERFLIATYEIYDPESQDQEGFFESGVVHAYALNCHCEDLIQKGFQPHYKTFEDSELRLYREDLLEKVYGYDVTLPSGKVLRKRHSTSGNRGNVAKMHRMLEEVREIGFEADGYIFPDAEEYKQDPVAYPQKLFKLINARYANNER